MPYQQSFTNTNSFPKKRFFLCFMPFYRNSLVSHVALKRLHCRVPEPTQLNNSPFHTLFREEEKLSMVCYHLLDTCARPLKPLSPGCFLIPPSTASFWLKPISKKSIAPLAPQSRLWFEANVSQGEQGANKCCTIQLSLAARIRWLLCQSCEDRDTLVPYLKPVCSGGWETTVQGMGAYVNDCHLI